MNTLIPKLNIEKDSQELKVYMFTVQGGPVQVEFPEDFKAVMAYNDTDALNLIRKDYPMGAIISVRKRATVPVKMIIDTVNLQPTVAQDLKVIVAPPVTPQEKTVRDFVYGMMFVADKYITNKRDKTSLKRILKKVKLYEDTSIPTTKENTA